MKQQKKPSIVPLSLITEMFVIEKGYELAILGD